MLESKFQADSREAARSAAREAFALLAHGFNHCDNLAVPHKYAPDVQHRFSELLGELFLLVERGDIEPNPRYARYLLAQEARSNQALQDVIRRASRTRRARRA